MSKFSFTVDRSKWRCGGQGPNAKGEGETFLRNDQDYYCCLGFACLAAGRTKERILNEGSPGHLHYEPGEITGDTEKLVDQDEINTTFTNEAILINDSGDLTDIQREEALIKLGSVCNIKIDFIGEYK